ncbi:MAG: molybdopterin-binding protein [Methylovulum sp.]|nr:molybdopterin-binding protein [Methylovulum sp.]
MNPTLEIFSQGEEIVTGHTVDTNAAWLSQQAVALGFTVTRHTAVGDKLDDLVVLLKEISLRADCCICTGGLGPTSDDLTATAVAEAFGLVLEFDVVAFAHIQQFFMTRNRLMPESNRKQAMLPKGAERLDNEWGTAPGFAVHYQRCWFVFLPGVPSEMRAIFLEKVRPTLATRFTLRPSTLVSIKTFGIGESDIQQRIGGIAIPAQVQLGFRASLNEVQTKLLFPPNYPGAEMRLLVAEFADILGDVVFAVDGLGEVTGDLAFTVDQLMQAGKHTLAVVETASQGLLAGLCVGSAWLLETRYECSLARLAQKLALAISADDLLEAAKAVALATRHGSGADFVLVQLYAGDFPALLDKGKLIDLQTVLLAGGRCYQAKRSIAGLPQRKQNQAALLALDLLRRYLQGSVSDAHLC